MKVFRGKLESACLSIHVSVCQSVCVQNTSVCHSAGGGIKSHLVTALVCFAPDIFVLVQSRHYERCLLPVPTPSHALEYLIGKLIHMFD